MERIKEIRKGVRRKKKSRRKALPKDLLAAAAAAATQVKNVGKVSVVMTLKFLFSESFLSDLLNICNGKLIMRLPGEEMSDVAWVFEIWSVPDGIGRKSSRVLVTGGEDHKVNLWAIGKPNAILSLSGHTSGIDSVSFDSSELLVAAGAASGTIKLWDLEEAKIVRTLTGHRSNCISVDFHPFGEFFASGSLDTNLKIWDIRKKGCIHTYKGHTRGVNAIRFTPDGRWVVSGGEDNTVKLWDLTAGKLLHDFKSHEGQLQCIDFHPHEFLLATGSADRTVKFWDLETFELIGSAGPETAGVRCMTFNPDGKTLLCGLHESLKVFSWEPIRCHDAVDVGWSRLSDLNIHEGKLLGCSYNQSCVGVWVVDLSRIEPYAVGNVTRLNGHSESKSSSSGNLSVLTENTTKASLGRTNVRLDQAAESRKEVGVSGRTIPFSLQSRTSDFRKSPNRRDELERPTVSVPSENAGSKATDLSTVADRNIFPAVKCSTPGISAAERNVKDDRCIGSGRQEMNSTMEPPPNYHHENYQKTYLSWLLMWFETISGLKINLTKSELILVGRVEVLEELAFEVGCKLGVLPTTYLGLPLDAAHNSLGAWDRWKKGFVRNW
uniref:Katanin p80 WD40 repeat-containing subunit B1 homolog n=1 Tax=Vitis vinifera TaxID=29760 RepID=A5AVC7_VITVI|nr:hypothetical protein VITISV_026914 [Vitis vinifera]